MLSSILLFLLAYTKVHGENSVLRNRKATGMGIFSIYFRLKTQSNKPGSTAERSEH